MQEPALMVGLGEILWDVLPAGRVLGGAPTNFAYMSSVLGDRGVVASRLGDDALGREARERLELLGLTSEYVQEDCRYPTGTAEVSLDLSGQPSFTIREPVAWDFLEWTPEWEELAARADVICFGSLAQRNRISATAIDHFLRRSRPDALKVFDANLRQSYYDAAILMSSLEHANILKLSDQELFAICPKVGIGNGDEERLAGRLIEEFQLDIVCVTRAEKGSLLVSASECVRHPGFAVEVVDAVGAGDAFTACLAHYFIRGFPLLEIGAYANRLASWVATQRGATPAITSAQVQRLFLDLPQATRG